MITLRHPNNRDDGFSLVELIISVALFSIIMTIVGGIIISSFQADRTVREVTTSTTDGQLVVNVVEQTVRNSTAVQVVPGTDGASSFATARSTVGGSTQCAAWFYDASTDTIYQQRSTAAITAPLPGSVGSGWSVVSSGIVPDDDAGGTAYPVFEAQGTRGLTVRFAVEGDSGPASLFITSVTGRAPQSNVSPQCF